MSEKPFDHYLSFEPLDFVMDEDFQEWVFANRPEQDAYWQSFRLAFPARANAVDNARQLIRQLRVTDWQTLQPHQLHARFAELTARLEQPAVRSVPLYRQWWMQAAATVLLGVFGWQLYQYGWASTVYQTPFAAQERILLADQTVVTLAANSLLRVPGRWQFGRQREVWLTGEAYFEVTKQPASDPEHSRNFVVHARELRVEVLGTRFNVNTFRSKTTILLDEGKVRLSSVRQPRRVLVLKPGQLAEYPVNQSTIRIESNTEPTRTAWRDGRLLFRGVSLAELSQRVDERYGLSLVFDGGGWDDATFTGELPTTDAPLMARILTETFAATVDREDNQLIFRKSVQNP